MEPWHLPCIRQPPLTRWVPGTKSKTCKNSSEIPTGLRPIMRRWHVSQHAVSRAHFQPSAVLAGA